MRIDPPDLKSALEEIDTLHCEIARLHARAWSGEAALDAKQQDLEHAVEEILETRGLATFWRRCAEQALRLWDQAQDEIERQKALVKSSCTFGESLANMIDGNLAVARDAFEHYKSTSTPEDELDTLYPPEEGP